MTWIIVLRQKRPVIAHESGSVGVSRLLVRRIDAGTLRCLAVTRVLPGPLFTWSPSCSCLFSRQVDNLPAWDLRYTRLLHIR